MKPGIHPDYHEITVVLPTGDSYITRSTYGAPGAKLSLDISPETHPAWTGGTQNLTDRAGRVSSFNKRFAGMTFGAKKPA